MDGLASIIERITGLPSGACPDCAPEELRSALKICLKLARTVITRPEEPRFRMVMKENRTFKTKVLDILGPQMTAKLLSTLGFTSLDDSFVCCEFGRAMKTNMAALERGLNLQLLADSSIPDEHQSLLPSGSPSQPISSRPITTRRQPPSSDLAVDPASTPGTSSSVARPHPISRNSGLVRRTELQRNELDSLRSARHELFIATREADAQEQRQQWQQQQQQWWQQWHQQQQQQQWQQQQLQQHLAQEIQAQGARTQAHAQQMSQVVQTRVQEQMTRNGNGQGVSEGASAYPQWREEIRGQQPYDPVSGVYQSGVWVPWQSRSNGERSNVAPGNHTLAHLGSLTPPRMSLPNGERNNLAPGNHTSAHLGVLAPRWHLWLNGERSNVAPGNHNLPNFGVLTSPRLSSPHRGQNNAASNHPLVMALPSHKYTASADRECQICLENYDEGDDVKTLPCFHMFHSGCADQWLHINWQCPTCRTRIDDSRMHTTSEG
eukprot:GEMP01014225.1.p1 GENE.GEMP01014225.1~~GEMP01014225.1.p1  ORF type:complete len:492 (+),score=111.03 GEMP01014225.1:88-1563(+)